MSPNALNLTFRERLHAHKTDSWEADKIQCDKRRQIICKLRELQPPEAKFL